MKKLIKNIINVCLVVLPHILVFSQSSNPQHDSLLVFGKTRNNEIKKIRLTNDSLTYYYISDSTIFREGWDTLKQVIFWRQVIKHHPDTSIVNVASTRQILEIIPSSAFDRLSSDKKIAFKDSIRRKHGIDSSLKIFVTSGKNHFYDFSNALQNISRSIPVFIENDVDPWYAQAILLIESPNKLQKSTAGAYGSFQLMKAVAKKYGLKITKKEDERRCLIRSAYAASMLIKKACIPYVKRMLDTQNIQYRENDLFFRLLVLHCYHAGAGNVMAAFRVLNPQEGGISLFQKLWQTEAAKFGNASQNYSQVALAAMIEFTQNLDAYNKQFYSKSIEP